MNYRYFTCDVFTRDRFCGNQLAVIPDARGLNGRQMQKIANEFNFSETTFVFPPESGGDRKVRIFTPAAEVPFAGHPNIGTAFILATSGELGQIDREASVVFEEAAGNVSVLIRTTDHGYYCELKAPQALTLGDPLSTELAASLLGLDADDIVLDVHPPQSASVGLPFLVIQLRDREALARAQFNLADIDRIRQFGAPHDVHLYTHDTEQADIQARMFAPLDGVPEDPATGSANCAMAALLTHYAEEETGEFSWKIAQGIEMGRPSLLNARTTKENGSVNGIWIAGHSVLVAEGSIRV